MILLLLATTTTATALAAEPPGDEPPPLTESQVFLGLGASVAFGFGSGQAIQGRWQRGLIFTAADSVGLLFLFFAMGSSAHESESAYQTRLSIGTAGSVIYLTSRAVQLIEVATYSIIHHPRRGQPPEDTVQLMILPTPDTRGLIAAGRWSF